MEADLPRKRLLDRDLGASILLIGLSYQSFDNQRILHNHSWITRAWRTRKLGHDWCGRYRLDLESPSGK